MMGYCNADRETSAQTLPELEFGGELGSSTIAGAVTLGGVSLGCGASAICRQLHCRVAPLGVVSTYQRGSLQSAGLMQATRDV